MKNSLRAVFPFALAVSIAASLGGYFTNQSVTTWYPTLAKPDWNPPAYLFGPVWTTLYALMAYSAWRVYSKAEGFQNAKVPLTLWGIQLVLNTFWSYCFFALRSPLCGLIEVLFLMVFVYATTWQFYKHDRLSGLLLLPYCAWGSFASVLTAVIWRLNS